MVSSILLDRDFSFSQSPRTCLNVSIERWRIVRERGVFDPPNLVVEIASPPNAQRDFQEKLALYRRYGIRQYWIVDMENRSVDFWLIGEPWKSHKTSPVN